LIEQERIAKLETERRNLLLQFGEFVPASLGLMDQSVFEAYYKSQKQAYELRIQAEKQAEIDRIEREKAEAAERERIRLENEQLKIEAEKREKAIVAEREKQAKELARQKAESDAKQKAIEDAARIEREKQAAKAPDKDKLKVFVQSITLPVLPELKQAESQVVLNVIASKFEAFKVWASQQIESI
jgi:hypothetical protein